MRKIRHESEEYIKARDELRLAEIELVDHVERVAELRRALPMGPVVDEYEFVEGSPSQSVRLSSLFTAPGRALVVYHLMYGKAQTSPCPMCTLWIDGFNGVAHHLAQNVDFVVVAAADPGALRVHGAARGWDRLRLLSCGENTFKYDFGSEDEQGNQDSTVSVFTRDVSSVVRHTYSAHPRLAADRPERGLDALCALWNLLDLTPAGRGDWYASLSYDA